MLDLVFGATFSWYGLIFFFTHFLSELEDASFLTQLFHFGVIFLLTFLICFSVKQTQLYRYNIFIYLIATLITVIFYWQKWLEKDVFNYFSLFLTNILYCMMIFYSLQDRYLL